MTTINPGNYDFIIYAGRTLSKLFTYQASNGNPIDLTGCTAQMEARYNLTDASPFLTLTTSNGGITLGNTAGTIAWSMSPAQTASLVAGQGVYDMEITFASGDQESLLQGIVTVQEMPTR